MTFPEWQEKKHQDRMDGNDWERSTPRSRPIYEHKLVQVALEIVKVK